MKLVCILFVVLVYTFCVGLYADTIPNEKLEYIVSMIDGEIKYCNLISDKGDSYLFQLGDSSIIKIPKNEVDEINPNPIAVTNQPSIESVLSSSSIVELDSVDPDGGTLIGITLLTPGFINAVMGHVSESFGARIDVGLLFESMIAFQAELMYPISFRKTSFVGIGMVFGSIQSNGDDGWYGFSDEEYIYAGIILDANLFGFDLNFGLTFGSESFSEPGLSSTTRSSSQFLISLGYVHWFND